MRDFGFTERSFIAIEIVSIAILQGRQRDIQKVVATVSFATNSVSVIREEIAH